MTTFDVASDIHLDFWAAWGKDKEKSEQQIDAFIEKILPETPSKILIIPGDLGHHNEQNALFLQKLRAIYSTILLTPGNHDYYLITSKIKYKYQYSSMRRWSEMVKMCQEIDGVHVLNGETRTIDGVTFGGVGMWYDFTYAQKVWHDPIEIIRSIWQTYSNDSKLIIGLPAKTLEMFAEEQAKLEKILDKSDVLFTHVGPDFKVPSRYQFEKSSSFYYFNADPYIDRIQGKMWFFGHTHERFSYEAYDCTFHNCAIGYPEETKEQRKIMTFSHKTSS